MDSNVADLQRNDSIGKVFELAEPRFHHDMERDFRIRAIFPYHNQNRNPKSQPNPHFESLMRSVMYVSN